MKKTTQSFLTFIILSFSLQAQVNYKINESNYQKVSLSFTFENLKSIDVHTDAGSFSRIYMDGCSNSSNTGDPEMPVSVNMIEIPFCEDYVINVYGNDFVIYDAQALGINHPVYPAQPSLSKSHEGPIAFIQNQNTYQTDAFYALPLAQFEKVGFMRNVNLGEIHVCPVQYNPVTQEIKIYQSIDVEILFKKTNVVKTQTLKELHSSLLFRPSHLINSMKSSLAMENSKAEFFNAPIKYLIVAHSMFRGALDEFIAWKKRKGFLVEIGYTDDKNVGTTTTSIAAFIKSHYANATSNNPAPTFVLLVGDVEQIPTFAGTTDIHPTDLYYFTWEAGNIPCCYYGRFSAQNLAQLTPQIEKTLQYEQYTMPNSDYLNKISLIAGFDKDYAPIYGNGLINYITQNYANTQYGYATVYTHYHPCNVDAAQIRAEIGEGVGIANFTAHCNETGWANPDFTTNHISAMNNLNKYGLMIGSCCLSNKFDYHECFGEGLLRAAGKGAVGYLGGSNNTYWNEDYFWGIGLRSLITDMPVYDAEHLGAYDKLFHTHNETHDKWMVTFGAMNMAGNESVQSSTSNIKKYYWEIYHLMGDPSLMAYLTKPTQMKVELPDEILAGETVLNAKVAPYAYCALTDKNKTLLNAGFADATGNITLHFDPIGDFEEYEFAAWAQNYIQHFQTIKCTASEESYLVGSIALAPESTPHNGATIAFEVTLKNMGNKAISNIKLSLGTESSDVVIMDNTATVSSLAVGEEKIVANLFQTNVKDFVQDETPMIFFVNIVSDKHSFQKSITIIAQAPKLEVTRINVSKTSGNGEIAPGDEVDIEFELANIGTYAIADVFSSVSCYSSHFKLLNNTQTVAEIGAGKREKIVFKGKIETSIEKGAISVYFSAFKGSYETTATGIISINTIVEDFETGKFSKFDWKHNANPWEITALNVFEGAYSARSKSGLANNSTSRLKITAYIPTVSNMSYARRISSKTGSDFFRFYIDDAQQEQLSGTLAPKWGKITFEVAPGIHTFTFEYSKGANDAAGEDCAWIDNVLIPGITLVKEDLSKLKVTDYIIYVPHKENKIIADSAHISFTLHNIGFSNAYNITGELLCDIPQIKIVAENTNSNKTLPFSMTVSEEKSIEFKITPPLLKNLSGERIDFVLKVAYDNDIIYYPIVLEFAELNNSLQTTCLLYPNPVHNTMTIESKNQMSVYEIFDINGKKIISKENLNNYTDEVNVSSLANGIYFVKVIDNEQKIAVQKFIKY